MSKIDNILLELLESLECYTWSETSCDTNRCFQNNYDVDFGVLDSTQQLTNSVQIEKIYPV